jgi:hypothetical protein
VSRLPRVLPVTPMHSHPAHWCVCSNGFNMNSRPGALPTAITKMQEFTVWGWMALGRRWGDMRGALRVVCVRAPARGFSELSVVGQMGGLRSTTGILLWRRCVAAWVRSLWWLWRVAMAWHTRTDS